MDKLTSMVEFQAMLQKKIIPGYMPSEMSYDEKVELTRKYALFLHEEVSEVMQSLKYKEHRKYDKTYDEEDTKTEIIDCLKFVINLALLWGMDAEEIQKVFNAKSIINIDRLNKYEK